MAEEMKMSSTGIGWGTINSVLGVGALASALGIGIPALVKANDAEDISIYDNISGNFESIICKL